ncbi:MAG: zf-HC2 domain-containing protein [Armatimonadetes bacterium]|nr:zf-HC2 domain-containing protein [Armatimonadota bacterium]
MKCGQVQEKLSCYLDGVLDESTLEAVERHLASCEDCRRELEMLASVVGFASEIEEVAPPAYLSSSIKDAIRREREAASACAPYLPMLSEYIDGELPPEDSAELEAHLTGCHACANELVMLQKTLAAVKMVSEVAPPASLRGQIAAATTGGVKSPVLTLRERLASLINVPRLSWAAGTAVAAAAVTFLAISPRPVDEKPVATVVPVTPPVVSQAPQEAPEVEPQAPQPPQKVAEAAVRRAIRRVAVAPRRESITVIPTKVERAETTHRVAAAPKAAEVNEPRVRVPIALPPPPPFAITAAPKKAEEPAPAKETVVVAKTAEPATPEPKEETEPRVMKIAITPNTELPQTAEFFKDIKVTAEMRRRADNTIRVDVINKRY